MSNLKEKAIHKYDVENKKHYVYDEKDVKEAVNDFQEFLNFQESIGDEEELYYRLSKKYDLNIYEDTDLEAHKKIFGEWEE